MSKNKKGGRGGQKTGAVKNAMVLTAPQPCPVILLCAKLHNNSVISNAGIQKSLFLGIALHILHRQSLVSDIEFLEFSCSLEEMLGFIF